MVFVYLYIQWHSLNSPDLLIWSLLLFLDTFRVKIMLLPLTYFILWCFDSTEKQIFPRGWKWTPANTQPSTSPTSYLARTPRRVRWKHPGWIHLPAPLTAAALKGLWTTLTSHHWYKTSRRNMDSWTAVLWWHINRVTEGCNTGTVER